MSARARGPWHYMLLVGFAACVPLANWLIENVGVTCVPDGPCLVPVAPGLEAPSGVLVIGIALVLRDFVQRSLGIRWAMGAIGIGTVLSLLTASPGLVLASVIAFVISETIDLAVYTRIARRSLAWAVLASGVVGAVADSLVFIWLAFGTLDYVLGQVVGKLWASLLGFVALTMLRGRAQTIASRG